MLRNDLYQVTEETLDSLSRLWGDAGNRLKWPCLFVSPPWLKAWMGSFGSHLTPYLRAVWINKRIIGVAPLTINLADCSASFMGDASVCDYQDFITVPGREIEFYECLIRDLRKRNIKFLVLESVRADSSILTRLRGLAAHIGCQMVIEDQDVALAVELPQTWEKYIAQLSGKQRHEIRRKFRRLHEAGTISFVLVENAVDTAEEMATFLKLFKKNRRDKAAFMNQQMTVFFRFLEKNLAETGILKLYELQINGIAAAVVMCFDFQSTRYLYNNAYDNSFNKLSVGIMSKILSLKDAIQSGLKTYDFLKGGENYKKRLGGKPIKLFNCRVELV